MVIEYSFKCICCSKQNTSNRGDKKYCDYRCIKETNRLLNNKETFRFTEKELKLKEEIKKRLEKIKKKYTN